MNGLCVNDLTDTSEVENIIEKKELTKSDKRKKIHSIFLSYRKYENYCGLLAIFSIIAFVVDYEQSYNVNSLHNECSLSKSKTENMRIMIVFCSLSALYFLLCRYLAESKWLDMTLNLKLNKPTKYAHRNYKFWRRVNLGLEIGVLIIMPIPYFDFDIMIPQHYKGENITLCYRLNTIFFCFGMSRIYFPMRVLVNRSVFNNEQALVFCINNNVNAGFSFAVKCMVYTHPYRMIGFLALITIIIGAILTRILERPIDSKNDLFYDSILNYFWYIFETISTLGYGEYTCITYSCRIITVFTWFFGSVLVGLLISALQQTTSMSKNESKSFSLIFNCVSSAKLLKSWVRLIEAKKKKKSEKKIFHLKVALEDSAQVCKGSRLLAKEQCRGFGDDLGKELQNLNLKLMVCSKKLDKLIDLYK